MHQRQTVKTRLESFALLLASCCATFSFGEEVAPLNSVAPDRLPAKIENRAITPDLGCFWAFELGNEDYKTQVDALAPVGAFDALTLTLRANNTIVDNQKAIETTKKAVEYAREKYGIGALLDVDLRIARYDFEKERPDLTQERLCFKESALEGAEGAFELKFSSPNLSDHYTGNLPYYVRGGRVVKAWCYRRDAQGAIVPESIVDVSELVSWNREQHVVANLPGAEVDSTSVNELSVSCDRARLAAKGDFVTVAVAFRYAYPDLFADETLELERRVYKSFASAPALGVAKDEWGFPPHFTREDNLDDFWYSERMRDAYAKRFESRDLLEDLFLAFRAQSGKDAERVDAVDRFRRLCGDRVVEYEIQNYNLTKEIWGKDAFVGVHCTWYPWPNVLEMRKDGVMWWKAPRDVAQTDEYAPFCARNAMAKGCGSLWVNMFYARTVPPYVWEHWTAAASGGRVHIHQIYPNSGEFASISRPLLPIVKEGGVARIRSKIRMLNLIGASQIDSPVAVIFGRFGASNPLRPEYKAVGWEICDRFSTQGYPADLIPIDEIFTANPDGQKRWSIGDDGYLRYGAQKYQALILYGENDAEKDAFDALRALKESVPNSQTRLFDLSATSTDEEKAALVEKIVATLQTRGIVKQTPYVRDDYTFTSEAEISSRPPRTATSRFLDGTVLWIAATENDLGDPIELNEESVQIGARSIAVSAKANGVFAARFDDDGNVNAFVAAELRSLQVGELQLDLSNEELGDDPVDVAIWRGDDGAWRGVFQRRTNDLPKALKDSFVKTWNYLERKM